MLEGLRCCDILESIQTYAILVWKVGYRGQSCCHPRLKSRCVIMVVGDEFKSQPCKTIHYTHNETLEGLSWCELLESVQTHSILMWKVEEGQARFVPTRDWKTCCDDHFRAHIPISTFSNHSLYLWWEVGRVKLVWNSLINPNILRLRCET